MSETKKKVMIVDDDILIRETVRLALLQAGYDAIAAEDGDEAEELIPAEKPDLIILDLYMPGTPGIELCRKLKTNAQTKNIPIMIFTGSNDTVDVMSGIDAGAFQYITKPVDGNLLIAKIKGVFKAHA
jgi:DNA-binding response OmpR family regulator